MTRDTTHADRDDIAATLNSLVETCKDGATGFRTAADGVEEPGLRRLFSSYAEQRAQFATELQALVQGMGGDPADHGHVAGALHRGWINLKATMTGKDDAAVISECERGEDFAKDRFRKALQMELPAAIRVAVERQYMQVQQAQDHIRSLEQSYSKK